MDEPMQDLAAESFMLLEKESKNGGSLHDYSFVVFPIAKAYEGFLKKLFRDLGFINKSQYRGDRFRIGRALNPNLPKRYQWDWVYAKLVGYCQEERLPLHLWEVWKTARNKIFHYFPDHHEFISLTKAKELVDQIAQIMDEALAGCRVP